MSIEIIHDNVLVIRVEDKTNKRIWIYYIMNVVNLLHKHVSTTFCSHPEGGIIQVCIIKTPKTNTQI